MEAAQRRPGDCWVEVADRQPCEPLNPKPQTSWEVSSHCGVLEDAIVHNREAELLPGPGKHATQWPDGLFIGLGPPFFVLLGSRQY